MPNPTTFASVMTSQFPRLAVLSIEPLESRIAPATFIVGTGGISFTDDSVFINVKSGIAAGDGISKVIGGADPDANANVYYLKLLPGDLVGISENGGASHNYITGKNGTGVRGTAIAVFVDNGDGIVETNELTGISLGKNAQVQVSGSVAGDVVANYNDATGSLGGASESGGAATDLLLNPITFFGASSVTGNIVAGGDISGINITSNAGKILTGAAANGVAYDLNGSIADGGDTFSVTPIAGKRGPNISHVTAGNIDRIEAGAGGAGALGGSISKITLLSDTSGWIIKAGDGGSGAGVKPKGGNGGTVSDIFANGLVATQSDATANDAIQVLGGLGGAGSGTAAGGKGGLVKNVSIGYEVGPKGNIQASINTVSDSVLVEAGAGGAGKIGGSGGTLANIKVSASPTLSGNDLVLHGGAGGNSTAGGGKAGAGGGIKTFDLRNPGTSNDAQQSRMFVDAGDGGLAVAGSAGANGGSTEAGVIVGFSIGITGGTGSVGTKGGSGGSVKNITSLDGFGGVRAKNVAIDAGGGGTGLAGKGGNGGIIDGLTVTNPELSQFDLNQTAGAGDGANSQSGVGGNGGGIFNIVVNDLDSPQPSEVLMRISAGDGGIGGNNGGGKGGAIGGKTVLSGVNASLNALAGNGGSANGKGSGGAGGSVTNLSFNSTSSSGLNPVTANVAGGTGGVGVLTGKGGSGGGLSTLSFVANGDIVLLGGTGGGGGTTGAAGAGGSIGNIATISESGLVSVVAGAAGATGGKAGAGGAISQLNAQAAVSIEVRAGNGSQGGAGGSIKEVGATDVSAEAGPANGLTIVAGDGSGAGSTAGAGGSISGVDGFIAVSGQTLIKAGQGGGVSTKAGVGGSVTTVSLRGGGGPGAIVSIEAGDAGDSPSAKTGAKGGSVSDVGIGLRPFVPGAINPDPTTVQEETLIRHIAAGDGGDGGATGGAGGSINGIRVHYAIGAMSGEVFGYSTMGGLFSGAGGSGTKLGVSGSVLSVSADSIAAILAGKLENGQTIQQKNLAGAVDGIVMNSSVPSIVDATGAYRNYDSASVLGAIRNPSAANANVFDSNEYVDANSDSKFSIGDSTNTATDGFVAAVKFGTNLKLPTNVRPEALLTLDDNGASLFIDLNNTNGQVVVA